MSLWIDRREELKANPAPGRTHALIIGTSKYRWLPKQGQPPVDAARETLGLHEVDICATSALKLAIWLRDNFQNKNAPLATIRLCVNPSDEELEKVAGMKDLEPKVPKVIGTTRKTILDDLREWKKDCENNPAGIAILYASGHGISRGKEESLILLEDFADDEQIFTYSIDVGSNRKAMVGDQMPQTQLYFADACRLPDDTKLDGLGSGATLKYPQNPPPDKRSAPIYYSALPGMAALGVKQKGTFFTQALIECLDGVALAGPNKKSNNPLEQQHWHVSVSALLAPLDQRVRELADAKSEELKVELPDQGVTMGGEARAAVFHVLESPPKVEITVEVLPDTMAQLAKAALFLPTRKGQIGDWQKCWPRPCLFEKVDAGIYSMDVHSDAHKVTGVVVIADPPKSQAPTVELPPASVAGAP